MTRKHPLRLLASSSAAVALFSAPGVAWAQAQPLPESIAVGSWTFRPSLELRLRGEYRRHPIDTGGATFTSNAVLYDGFKTPLESYVRAPSTNDQYFVAERARLGLAVDRGPVTAAFVLQDARAFASGAFFQAPGDLPSGLTPYEAYIDAHTRSGRKVFVRLGRQRVAWGDGRLVGANDWSLTGRALDAVRFGFQAGDFDVEMMGALLAAPSFASQAPLGARSVPTAGTASSGLGTTTDLGTTTSGPGAQLYGLDVVWHLLPLLNFEALGLARIARMPLPSSLTPSNTFVVDGRIFGERRGFSYAAEGAYELGNVASYGLNRDLGAFALAARAGLETSLPWHLTFGVEGAYASGDDGSTTGKLKRFDPILPDTHTTLGPMGLFAWSNLIEAGGTLSVRPVEELQIIAGYRNASVATSGGRWITAALLPVGAVAAGATSPGLNADSKSLGNEIDATVRVSPWKALGFEAGYGLFLFGDHARQILRDTGRPATLQHWAYLQAVVHAP